MSNEKLIELSKPVAYVFDHGVMGPGDFSYGTPQMHSTAKDENARPLYSQEYVSALLAELEAKTKHVAQAKSRTASMNISSCWRCRISINSSDSLQNWPAINASAVKRCLARQVDVSVMVKRYVVKRRYGAT
ncbi:hypothetical protein CR62_16640 [Serratia grimesii]|uniref:Uncharacterized protein n=1 Tax=Serratia grimesii TaxID=82995 RepID=A0ABR4UCW2_9GAMM|nr:hypothetical protein CR62_16640 [Serratia grimesii]